MPNDETLATRIRTHLADTPGLSEKKMFGGVCFLLNGNMACGVANDELMLRLGNEGAQEAWLARAVAFAESLPPKS